MPNRFVPITPGTDESQQIAMINKNFAELDNESVKKLYYGADGVPRIYIDGTTGVIKVAPEGVDVTTAASGVLTFNSDQNVFKIVESGTIDLPAFLPMTLFTAGTYTSSFTSTIPHGLGYVPAVICYLEYGGGYYLLPYTEASAGGTGGGIRMTTLIAKTDADNFYVFGNSIGYGTYSWAGQVPLPATRVRYYLLQESAA